MVKACEEKHGKNCENWNHEGQWLIGDLRADLFPIMNSGAMCPANLTAVQESPGIADRLWKQWSQYWNLSQPILVEKSPQSMLKIPLMHKFFGHRHKLRFLIVIKVRCPFVVPYKYKCSKSRNDEFFQIVKLFIYNDVFVFVFIYTASRDPQYCDCPHVRMAIPYG